MDKEKCIKVLIKILTCIVVQKIKINKCYLIFKCKSCN